jgi:type I restriction enzyme S subunit
MTDWPVKTLGDICEVFDDGDWIESKDQAPSGVRLIQTGNVGDGEFKNRSDKARFISESTFTRLRCTEIFPGDLLVSRLPDPVGRACLIPDTGSKMITAVDCTIMRPRKEIMQAQFLVLSTQTSSYREQVQSKITGTTRDRISRSNLSEVQVAVPPLEEQRRIVALLDAATARVNELTACYEQARTHANNLFSSALREALVSDPNWPIKTLGDFCEIYQPQTIGMKDMIDGGKYVVYGANGPIGLYDRFNHEKSEVTVTCRGATCGTVNVTPPQVWITGNAMVVRPIETEMTKQMMRYVLEGLDYSSIITGAAQPQITRQTIAPTSIQVPPLEEQKRIVARLDLMKAKTSEMVSAYEAKLTAAKNLRQSILEAAFAGEL